MQGGTDTAVVILSYNSRKWHELFLPLIVSEAIGQYDVYVVDHASTEPLSDYIACQFPDVHYIRLTENHGFAWGYAEALKQIEARYYVLLSADFEVTPGWFRPLHEAMEAQPEMAACQPKVRYYKDREYFEYAGAAGGFKDSLGYLFCRGRIFDTLEKDIGQYNDDREIFWASGGCFMTRASVYHQMGGLDPDLYAHMEEVDLCWRMKNAGYKIGYVGGSTVFHVGGSVISYGSPQKTFYNFRNNLVLLLKNEKKGKLYWLLPLRLVLDGLAGIQFLMKGQEKNVLAILEAHYSFYSRFRMWRQKRATAQALLAPIPDKKGILKGSIIIQYFIKGKKKFSELKW
jgi:GT2 family glycosyltransferase